MTILKAAYGISKFVQGLSCRRSVKDLMKRLNSEHRTIDLPNGQFVEFGYRARRRRRQFAGYLALYEELVEELRGDPPDLLIPAEVALLREAHQFIADLNGKLLEHTGVIDVRLTGLLDPFSEYNLSEPVHSPSCLAVAGSVRQNLFNQFCGHPSFQILRQWDWNQLDLSAISEHMATMRSDIRSTGALEVPKRIEDLEMAQIQGHGPFPEYQLIAALVALQDSLAVLNQLIYQAFQYNKLPVFDSDNVFWFERGSHALGEWTKVKAIGSTKSSRAEPGDLVWVKLPLGDNSTDGLHRIEFQKVSYSQETGHDFEYHLARATDNLTCFSGLID